jgi:hypothetical protein
MKKPYFKEGDIVLRIWDDEDIELGVVSSFPSLNVIETEDFAYISNHEEWIKVGEL